MFEIVGDPEDEPFRAQRGFEFYSGVWIPEHVPQDLKNFYADHDWEPREPTKSFGTDFYSFADGLLTHKFQVTVSDIPSNPSLVTATASYMPRDELVETQAEHPHLEPTI